MRNGHGEPGGVDRQQQHPAREIGRGGREAEDGAEHRTDAGRPPGPERHPHQHRTEKPDRLVLEVQPALLGQPLRLDHAEADESEGDDEDAADALQPDLVVVERAAERGGAGAEQDEDEREARRRRAARGAARPGAGPSISGSVMPVRNPTYDGTSGSTQGERKLSSPAAKATASPSAAGSFMRRHLGAHDQLPAAAVAADPVDLHPVPRSAERRARRR